MGFIGGVNFATKDQKTKLVVTLIKGTKLPASAPVAWSSATAP